LENKRLRLGGFFARLLICDTQLEPTEIPPTVRSIPPSVRRAYNDLIHCLLSHYWEAKQEYEIKVEPAARELLRRFHNELVPRRKTDLTDISSLIARWHEQAWRLAATCHAIEHGNLAHQNVLSVETMAHAIEMSRWFGAQQLQILAAARHALLREQATKLEKLLREGYPDGTSLRNLQAFHNLKPEEVNRLVQTFPALFEIFNGKAPGPGRSSPWIRFRKSRPATGTYK
jgi:hypothetical protein